MDSTQPSTFWSHGTAADRTTPEWPAPAATAMAIPAAASGRVKERGKRMSDLSPPGGYGGVGRLFTSPSHSPTGSAPLRLRGPHDRRFQERRAGSAVLEGQEPRLVEPPAQPGDRDHEGEPRREH